LRLPARLAEKKRARNPSAKGLTEPANKGGKRDPVMGTKNGTGGNGGTKPEPHTSLSCHAEQWGAIKELGKIAEQGKIYLAEIMWNETHADFVLRVDYQKGE
jgi:hypothetical protein